LISKYTKMTQTANMKCKTKPKSKPKLSVVEVSWAASDKWCSAYDDKPVQLRDAIHALIKKVKDHPGGKMYYFTVGGNLEYVILYYRIRNLRTGEAIPAGGLGL